MAEYILDEGMIEALRAAVQVSKTYAEEEMQEGNLSAEQYACFQVWRERLDDLSDVFGEADMVTGEQLH